MDHIAAPWRMDYILSNSDNTPKEEVKDGTGCIFCDFPKLDDDEKHLILHRGEHAFVILNAFPYNPGHLMVVPYRHTADFPGLKPEELTEMTELTQTACKTLTELMHPQGFNIGMNIGKIAGAGIDQHLHIHVVPRWGGDTNFMPVLGEVRVLSEANYSVWKRLKAVWPK